MLFITGKEGLSRVTVLDEIAKHESQFSRGHRRIAELIRSAPHECAMLSITDLAERAGVSEATVVRFSRIVGFSGYPDLKNALQQRLMERVSSWKRVEQTLAEMPDHSSVMDNFVGRQIEYMRLMVERIPDDLIDQAAREISKSQRIWLFGEGAAATPCHALQFWLGRFGLHVQMITSSGRRLFDDVVRAEKKDCLIMLAFGQSTPDEVALLDWTRKCGATRILITDTMVQARCEKASQVLQVERGPMGAFHSMAVPVALADAITLATARIMGERAVEAVKDLEKLRNRYIT